MKVLHAAETIKGGVATVLKQLVAAQQSDFEKYDIKCLIPSDQTEELDTAKSESVICWERKGRSVGALISFASAFVKSVMTFRPDIVHLHSSFAGVIGRVCLILLYPFVRPKVVYCPHAFSFLMETGGTKKRIYALIEKSLLPMTDAIICVSDYEAEQAKLSGISAKKLHVVHNGVPEKTRTLMSSKGPDEPIDLLFVGRFDFQKGYDVLANAMSKVSPEQLRLTVIGDSVHATEKLEPLPGAIYTGWLKSSQMEHYFQQADVLVIPSRWEGFAMVPLEAMSYSLPIVASDATSLPEVVRHHETGFLFKNGNVDSLVEILNSLKNFNLKDMGQKGNAFYLMHFTSEVMIKKTHEIYAEIIK